MIRSSLLRDFVIRRGRTHQRQWFARQWVGWTGRYFRSGSAREVCTARSPQPLPCSCLWRLGSLWPRFKGGLIHGFAEDGYVPLYKRFFLGGTKTIRGYNEDQILPVDDVHWPASEKYPLNDQEQANTKISLGGQVFWVSRTEFRFPLLPALEGDVLVWGHWLWIRTS